MYPLRQSQAIDSKAPKLFPKTTVAPIDEYVSCLVVRYWVYPLQLSGIKAEHL